MTDQNKLYILVCCIVGVLVSFLPAVTLPMMGSISLSEVDFWGSFILFGFIAIGAVSFFFYNETIKKFGVNQVHYALLGMSIIILLYLFNFLNQYSDANQAAFVDTPFSDMIGTYTFRPGIGLYLEILVTIFLILCIQFFDKYLPIQTKVVQKFKAK